MTEFTEPERDTIRTAAFGAIYLVSHADPGFFATIKESFAGSKALNDASPALRDLLRSGDLPQLPKGAPAEIEPTVLAALRQATQILRTKAPAELDPFRTAIIAACERVAAAHQGVQDAEAAATDRVKAALADR